MSSHSSSQSTVSCTKLCIKNNFLLKFMFSASCFSPSTVCCLVSPTALFLFCWILSLPLYPPAYFHSVQQPSTTKPVLHNTNSLHSPLFLLFLYIPSLCPFVSSFSLAIWLPFSAGSLASSTLAYHVSFLLGHCHFLCTCLLLRLPEFLFPLSTHAHRTR